MKIAKVLTDLIGNTPLLELSNYNKKINALSTIVAKLEMFNPLSSVKDRAGNYMIVDAENKGLLNKDTVIIEPTSGNTGIGIAFSAASKGYKVILTMPESMSIERRRILAALGAELILTPKELGMKGSIEKAKQLNESIENSIILGQFSNKANPEIHRLTTAQEILNDTDGKVDIFVSAVGTGGTITGVSEILKQKNPNIKVVAVEPFSSPVISGGTAAPHKIQGIGPGFIPEILNTEIIDEIIKIKDEEAFSTCEMLAKSEGLLVGISSGAACAAASLIAKRTENKDKLIVVVFPDTGERYLA